jgi:hypothetical protein
MILQQEPVNIDKDDNISDAGSNESCDLSELLGSDSHYSVDHPAQAAQESTAEQEKSSVEVDSLIRQRDSLLEEIQTLTEQLNRLRSTLAEDESRALGRLAMHNSEIERLRIVRDELEKEIEQLRQRARAHEQMTETSETPSLRSLLRSFSHGSENEDKSDIEMRTLRQLNTTVNLNEARTEGSRVALLEKQLAEMTRKYNESESVSRMYSSKLDEAKNENSLLSERCNTLSEQLAASHIVHNASDGDQKNLAAFTTEKETPTDSIDCLHAITKSVDLEDEPAVDTSDVNVSTNSLEQQIANDDVADDRSKGSKHSQIRLHAENMLRMAEKALDNKRIGSGRSVCSSVASSNGTELRPVFGGTDMKSLDLDTLTENHIFISNIGQVNNVCRCESMVLKNSAEHAEFYLPNIGIVCMCGRRKEKIDEKDGDPKSLENIFRDWQVRFLISVHINTSDDLVYAYERQGAKLASAMRKWRRQEKLKSVKTSSCKVALHIWARTCRSVVKYVDEQLAQGVQRPHRPGFLDISTCASEARTVSTLGIGSTILEDDIGEAILEEDADKEI